MAEAWWDGLQSTFPYQTIRHWKFYDGEKLHHTTKPCRFCHNLALLWDRTNGRQLDKAGQPTDRHRQKEFERHYKLGCLCRRMGQPMHWQNHDDEWCARRC